MMRGMFAAISGLAVHQNMLDVTANNIANVNTIGYKSERTSFEDALSQLQKGSSAPTATSGGTDAEQIGLGVRLGSINNVMTAGAVQTTGNPYDVAIQGDGFFRVVADPTTLGGTPTYMYTRAGNFTTDANGDLVTNDGDYVVGFKFDSSGNPLTGAANETKITIPAGSQSVTIGQNGIVSVTDSAGAVTKVAIISLAQFPNNAGLERVGGNNSGRHEQLRRRDGEHRRHERPRHAHAGRDRDVEREPRPGVHQHDHGRARLPGQQPCHLHRRRDAPGAREPEALVRLRRGRRLTRRPRHRFQPRRPPTPKGPGVIAVHRITQPDHELYVNPDLIQVIEANPDTVIVLANGTRFVVSETAAEVAELVRQWRASIVVRSRAPLPRDRPPGRLRPPRRRGRAAPRNRLRRLNLEPCGPIICKQNATRCHGRRRSPRRNGTT